MSWYGFAKPGDPRLKMTLARIHQRLNAGRRCCTRREQPPHRRGAFGICSFWAAITSPAAAVGSPRRGQYLTRLFGYATTSALGEEIDPSTGQALGNFPQASPTSG